ncbi:MAG: hypothetical protein ACLR6A_01300 [Candidatus Gastranaerophilaceae bacterium]
MKKLTSVFLSVMFILQLCNPLSATESVSQNSIILRSAEVPAGMNLGVSAVALHTDLSSVEAVLPHTLVFSENADYDSSSYEEYYPVTINWSPTENSPEPTTKKTGLYCLTGTPVFDDGMSFDGKSPVFYYYITVQEPEKPQLDMFFYESYSQSFLFPWVELTDEMTEQTKIFLKENDGDFVDVTEKYYIVVMSNMLAVGAFGLHSGNTYSLYAEYPGGKTNTLIFDYDNTIHIKGHIDGDRDGGNSDGYNPPDYTQPAPEEPSSSKPQETSSSEIPQESQTTQPTSVPSSLPQETTASQVPQEALAAQLPSITQETSISQEQQDSSVAQSSFLPQKTTALQVPQETLAAQSPSMTQEASVSGNSVSLPELETTTAPAAGMTEFFCSDSDIISGTRLRLMLSSGNAVFEKNGVSLTFSSDSFRNYALKDSDQFSVTIKQPAQNSITISVSLNCEDLSVLNDSILTVPYTREADAFYLEDATGSKTYAAQTDSVTMTASFLLPHTGTWTFYSETDGVTDATQEIAVVSASAGNKSWHIPAAICIVMLTGTCTAAFCRYRRTHHETH